MKSMNFLKYLGPGILVTVGFIDPGNWASNVAGGSEFGYKLLWVITLGTIILIILQHNVAHLGIVTGKCLSESIKKHIPNNLSKFILASAIFANISVAFAEILGLSLALQMLFKIPIEIGSIIGCFLSLFMIFTNTYKKLEKLIIGFVSIIGFSFIFELSLVDVNWPEAIAGSFIPALDSQSILVALGILGAIVMPHNLFLHSEIIQSRQWNLENPNLIKKQLKYELFDTFFSMILGWVINCAMIILSVSCFFSKNISVTELSQAHKLLIPLLGPKAGFIFALGLFFSGFSSSITAGMAGGTIFAGIFGKAYDTKHISTKLGIIISIIPSIFITFFTKDTLKALIYSQVILSFQLPITIASQVYLTSSDKVMGKYKNTPLTKFSIIFIGILVTSLNLYLLFH